ncbi:hypothetical protein P5V15_010166 [Pogonomyrmex californicus]
MLENWHPLALGDTVPKLFAAVLADHLTNWAIANRRLSPHNFVLQEALTDAMRSRRQAVVTGRDWTCPMRLDRSRTRRSAEHPLKNNENSNYCIQKITGLKRDHIGL